MRVISDKPLRDFWALHPDSETPLRAWYRTAKTAEWEKPDDVRAVYRDVDQVGKFTVFNIGGNKYRLIVVIHYNRGRIYVRHVLTHREYSKGKWKEEHTQEDGPKKDKPGHGKSPPPRRPRR
jgi:mRNA interferase HigB